MINILLLVVIFFVGWWSWDSQENYKSERDEFKIKYDSLYIRYTRQVDNNQLTQNQLVDSCNRRYNKYVEDKNREINNLVIDFNNKYNKLLFKIAKVNDNNE